MGLRPGAHRVAARVGNHPLASGAGVPLTSAGYPPSQLNGVHWVYFPEDAFIFYRVTVLSNFSPLVVAQPYKQWSLLVELSGLPYIYI